VEYLLSRTCLREEPERFFVHYRRRMVFTDAEPNAAHLALAELEKRGILKAVITQNIDGLHQKAGSKTVYELHGSVLRNYCVRCKKFHDAEFIKHSEEVPMCDCGGTVKPDVVLYEEPLDGGILMAAAQAISQADLLIVGGTSLTVYPAAGMLQYYNGDRLVLINREETPYDKFANLVFHESLGSVFSKL